MVTRARISALALTSILLVVRNLGAQTDTACTNAIAAAPTERIGLYSVPPLASRLGHCGRPGVAAAAIIFHAASRSYSTAWLDHLASFAMTPNGDAMLDTLISVAEDDAATTQGRVTALVTLINMRYPGRVITRTDVTGGFVDGLLSNRCLGKIISGQDPAATISSTDQRRILAMAQRVYANLANTTDVRTAASCLGGGP